MISQSVTNSVYISNYMCDFKVEDSSISKDVQWTTTTIKPTFFTSIEIYHHTLSPDMFNVYILFGNTWEYNLKIPVEQMSYIMLRRLVRGVMELFGDNYHSMMFHANRQETLHIDFIGTFKRASNSYK